MEQFILQYRKLSFDIYALAGFIAYSGCLIGLFLNISGLSLFPYISLGILLMQKRKLQIVFSLPAFLLMAVFIIGYITSYLFISVPTEYSTYKFTMFFVKMLPWFIIPSILQNKVENFLYGIWICLFIHVTIASVIAIKNIHQININNRLDIGNITSIWINRAVFELCLLTFCLKIHFTRRMCFILTIIALLITYATGSKGGIFSCLLVFCLYYLRNIPIKKKIFVVIIILISILVLLSVIPKDSYIFQRFFSAVPEGASVENVEQSRIVVWPESIDKIMDENYVSLVLGNGIGSFPVFYYGYKYDGRSYPHNIVLEILIENGLLFLFIILLILWIILRKSKSPLFLLFYYYILNAAFSGDLLLNEYVFLYLFLSIVHNKYYNYESVISHSRKLSSPAYN